MYAVSIDNIHTYNSLQINDQSYSANFNDVEFEFFTSQISR